MVRKCCGGNSGLLAFAKNYQKLRSGVLLCVTTPGYVRHNSRLCARQSMVITRQGDYTPDKNATSISGDGEGGERQSLLCLSSRDEAFYAYQLWKKIEIKFTQNYFFQRYGLSGWIFCSRQNTQLHVLDLSVLFKTVQIETGHLEYGGDNKAIRTGGLLAEHQN